MAGSPGSEELNEYLSEKYPDRRKRSLAFIKPLEELRKNFDISLSTAHHQQIMWFVHLNCCRLYYCNARIKTVRMEGTEDFINKVLVPIVTNFEESHLQIIGILPCSFLSATFLSTRKLSKKTIDKYGESNIFKSIVKGSDRLEMYGENGIQLNDYVDRRWWAIFADIFTELEERIEYYEQHGDIEGFDYTPKYADSMANHILPLGKEIKLNGIITNEQR